MRSPDDAVLAADPPALLTVDDLRVHFPIRSGFFQRQVGAVKAVDGVSFSIHERETFGLVGESGCGKSTLGRAILQVVKPVEGEVYFRGSRISHLRGAALRRVRRGLQMVFQDPFAALDPRMTVGDSVAEPLVVADIAHGRELRDRIDHLFELVHLDPRDSNRFPHQFSGGQCQRVGIARALASDPELIICDEPVSALDVSIQAQTLNLLMEIQERLGLTVLFIAHDLGIVSHMSDRVAVMYLGVIVELAPAGQLFSRPLHPYSRALISAVPLPDPVRERKRTRVVLSGDLPSPAAIPSGCRFRTRCPMAVDRCAEEVPLLREVATNQWAACHFAEEVPQRMPSAEIGET